MGLELAEGEGRRAGRVAPEVPPVGEGAGGVQGDSLAEAGEERVRFLS